MANSFSVSFCLCLSIYLSVSVCVSVCVSISVSVFVSVYVSQIRVWTPFHISRVWFHYKQTENCGATLKPTFSPVASLEFLLHPPYIAHVYTIRCLSLFFSLFCSRRQQERFQRLPEPAVQQSTAASASLVSSSLHEVAAGWRPWF